MPEAGSGSSRTIVRRAFVATVLIAVVAGSAVFVDRITVPRADATVPVPALRSGAWFCPHGGAPGWQGWVIITNAGPGDVRIRLTSFGASGGDVLRSFTVRAGSEVYGEGPAGGSVGHRARRTGRPPSAASARRSGAGSCRTKRPPPARTRTSS